MSEKKLGFMECIQMPGLLKLSAGAALCQLPNCIMGLSILDATGLDTGKMFTTNPDETAVHVTQWGWLASAFDATPFNSASDSVHILLHIPATKQVDG